MRRTKQEREYPHCGVLRGPEQILYRYQGAATFEGMGGGDNICVVCSTSEPYSNLGNSVAQSILESQD